ncbi:MAG TPA: efflux RND transporter periplasmic adaptor subunit [Tepidisphaeraceae bacterium]|jgi:RND family efflux transporter MFP subunit|nr:efflux RND transporter periplasmic adaptor subunit [Tepidisphaeraceae bacterium]
MFDHQPRSTFARLSGAARAVGVATATLSLALIIGCEEPEARGGPKKAEPIPVKVAKAEARTVTRNVEITGTLWGDQDVTISAKVPGRIADIFKDVGDRVTADEPLVQIDKTDYELEQRSKQMAVNELLARLGLEKMPPRDFNPVDVPTVRRAKLQAANAEARYNRGKQLHDQAQPLISDQDFADLRTAFDVAQSGYDVELLTARALVSEAYSRQAELAIATQRLTDTTLRAPVVAVPRSAHVQATTNPANVSFGVANRMVSVGEYVQAGTPLYRLIADDPIKLRASVPERFVGQIKPGQAVTMHVEAYPKQFTGTLSRINPQIDPANRTFQIEALFHNPDRQLQPGAFARGAIATHEQEGVIFVPRDAVTTFAGASKVFSVADGKAKEHRIQTAPGNEGAFVELTSGLTEPLEVIVGGVGRLANDMPVTVAPATQPAQ